MNSYAFTPDPAGVFGRTRPAALVVGQILPAPSLPNSRTDGRSEASEKAIESSQRELFFFLIEIFQKILKGHISGQGQVKGQNRQFSAYRLLRRD